MATILGKGEWLRENDSLSSPNGQFSLIMQDDANLVLYKMNGGVPVKALWSTQTNRGFVVPCGATMDSRFASLVVHEMSSGVEEFPSPVKALWSSDSYPGPTVDCFLELQDDGNLVIQANIIGDEGQIGDDYQAIWATNTGGG